MDGDNSVKRTRTNTPDNLANDKPVQMIKDPQVLYQKGFISEAQLRAQVSQSKQALEDANKEVENLAFHLTKTLTAQQAKTSKNELTSSEKQLIAKYKSLGYKFEPAKINAENAIKLLISPGSPGEINDGPVNTYLSELNSRSRTPNTPAWNKDTNITLNHFHTLMETYQALNPGKSPDLSVEIWHANDNKEPVKFQVGSGKYKLILLETQQGLFKVTSPNKGQPTSKVRNRFDDSDDDGSNGGSVNDHSNDADNDIELSDVSDNDED